MLKIILKSYQSIDFAGFVPLKSEKGGSVYKFDLIVKERHYLDAWISE